MKYKVIYIDDETSENSQAFADGLSSQGLVEIAVKKTGRVPKLAFTSLRDLLIS